MRYNLDTSNAEAMRAYYNMWIETDFVYLATLVESHLNAHWD